MHYLEFYRKMQTEPAKKIEISSGKRKMKGFYGAVFNCNKCLEVINPLNYTYVNKVQIHTASST